MPPIPKRYTIFVGVDPGASGGLAALLPSGILLAAPMPDSMHDIWQWVLRLKDRIDATPGGPFMKCDLFAWLENVHSMPGQGVSSTFKFGKSAGSLEMAIVAAGIPFEKQIPQTWQKIIGIAKRGKDETQRAFKQRLRRKALELFPKSEATLETADAILIAEACRRKRTGAV